MEDKYFVGSYRGWSSDVIDYLDGTLGGEWSMVCRMYHAAEPPHDIFTAYVLYVYNPKAVTIDSLLRLKFPKVLACK